jgi:ABC-2 type transport system permease protein
MRQVIASEWRKLRTTPTMWWLLGATVVVAAGGAILGFVAADMRDLAPGTGRGLQTGLHIVGLSSTLAEVAGIIGMAGEFRFGLADQTFLSTPRRGRVVAAKAIVYALAGAACGTLNAAVALVTAWIWLTAKGVGLAFGQSLLWSILGGGVASAALFALLGVGIGALLRNQVVTIIAVLVVQTVVEPSILGASTDVGRLLPSIAGEGLRRFPAEDLLSAVPAAAVLAAWGLAFLAGGLVRTRRADIT